jgi:serralysin
VPTLSEVTSTPLSYQRHIDALLGTGPAWNYQTENPDNTIYYSFSVDGYTLPENEDIVGAVTEFGATQQDATRVAMLYLSAITGIEFVESNGSSAQIHFVNGDITGGNVSGECLWGYSYETYLGRVKAYQPEAVIYLDDAEYRVENGDLTPGGYGYETLLHELGHMLGLKHPFEGDRTLPDAEDTTATTLMSYTYDGGPYYLFNSYDMAALKWLYGGDGLGGSWGVESVDGGVWLMGTEQDDVLRGGAGGDILEGVDGRDAISGGDGLDIALVAGARQDFKIVAANGAYTVASTDGNTSATMTSVERVIFDDSTVALDVDGNAGQAYRLYQAAFDRTPDAVGLGFWINALDQGVSLRDVAAGFIGSEEFVRLYGAHPDDATFVSLLYKNVLHRAPEQSGYDFWVNGLHNGADRARVLSEFSESDENTHTMAAVIGNGFDYTVWQGA